MKIEKLHKDDFVYLDPPYLISGAIYQDGKRGFKGWGQSDDLDLYQLCDKLNANGIKFAMSNMFESKGNTNKTLIDWAKEYNTNYLTMNYSSSNYQRTSNTGNKDVEVLITNY